MPRPPTADRARRILAILHHLTPDAEIPLERLASLVGVDPPTLASDLELLSVCGVAPYMPDQLVDVFVEDDGVVRVYSPLPALSHAVRLSGPEAAALAAALQAAGFDAGNPLTSRLLAAASLVDPEPLERVIRAAVSSMASHTYQTLALACERGEVVRIRYRSTGADSEQTRDVEPRSLLNDRGVWYVAALCRSAGAPRVFRLDRIRTATGTGEVVERSADPAVTAAFDATGLPVARVRFSPEAGFSLREWPGAVVAGEDQQGWTLVDVPYSGTAWISRRVVASLGEAELVSPPELRAAACTLANAAG